MAALAKGDEVNSAVVARVRVYMMDGQNDQGLSFPMGLALLG
jgi:hypothetical protein